MIKLNSICVDCPDPESLALFYASLLGIDIEEGSDSITIGDGSVEIWFQQVDNYQPPTWPSQDRGQQIHFDMHVDNRKEHVARAIALGASETGVMQEYFTVLLDPAGHPFCICESPVPCHSIKNDVPATE